MADRIADLVNSLSSGISPWLKTILLSLNKAGSWIVPAQLVAVVLSMLGIKLGLGNRKRSDRIIRRKPGPRKLVSGGAKVASGVATVTGLLALLGGPEVNEDETEGPEETNVLPKKQLGDIPFQASILGSGGVYIPRGSEAEGLAILEAEFAAGINYFDTATQYGNGESERRHGIFLERLVSEGRRDEVFIATKTLSRGYAMAKEEIENSFARLRVEKIDLLQLHAINNLEIWGQVSGANGALRAVEEAKMSGRVKHIGITNHANPDVLLQILNEYPFESVLCPLGITDRLQKPFVEEVLPYCKENGISVVGMKVFAEGKLAETEIDLEKCVHYTLSIEPCTAIIGMANPIQVAQNVGWVKTFISMSEDEKAELAENVRGMIDLTSLWWKQQ